MSPIVWDMSLETGDDAVDRQHKAIHGLFNHVESVADNAAEVMRALEFLTEHVLVHFATEEDLMAATGFPPVMAEAHIAEHRRLTDGVRDQVLAFRNGDLPSIRPVVDFLHEWLTVHVHACDRQLVEHVKSRGVYAELPAAWFAAEERVSA